MAKRIKDNKKRQTLDVGKKNREKTLTHLKLIQVFPKMKDRVHYIKSIIKDLMQPSDPILVEGKFPELE